MSKSKRVQRDWPTVLAAQLASDLSVAAFCRQQGIATSLFYGWRQRSQRQSAPTSGNGFVELQPVDPPPVTSGITMVSERGWRIELSPDFDTATLQRVLACGAPSGACSR